MKDGVDVRALWWLSIRWTAATIAVVLLWWFFSTFVVAEIAWLPAKLDAALDLDPLTRWRAWRAAPHLQAVVATLVAATMILISVLVGGWSRRKMAAVQDADGFRFVALPLLAAPLGGVLVAAAEPFRRSFADWPGGSNAFFGYFVIWALSLGYMMKLPWDSATELLKDKGAPARFSAMRSAKRKEKLVADHGTESSRAEATTGAEAARSASD